MKSVAKLCVFVLCVISMKGELYWEILERVTDFGQTAKLLCVTGSSTWPPVGHWDRYIPDSSITYAVITNASGPTFLKYYGKFVDKGFTLEIRNLSREDLNLRYECSVDINKSKPQVLLEEDVFAGSLNLVVLKKGINYGDRITLLCETESCNNKSCHWKYSWTKCVYGDDILIKHMRGQDGKYYIQLVPDGFTLEIRNVSSADLNVNYRSVLPFNKSEALNLTVAVAFEGTSSSATGNDKGLQAGIIVGFVIGLLVCLLVGLIFVSKGKHWCTSAIGRYHTADDVHTEEEPLVESVVVTTQRQSPTANNKFTEQITEDVTTLQDDTMTTDGRTRYARLSCVVLVIFKEMMINLANNAIQPGCLQCLLKKKRIFEKSLSPIEKTMFDGLTRDGYTNCDIGFVRKLLIQSGCLPNFSVTCMFTSVEDDVSVSDDVCRLLHSRYKLFSFYSTDISAALHEKIFAVFKAVGGRFDRHLEKIPENSYRRQIEEIENCCMDSKDVDHHVKEAFDIEKFEIQKTEKKDVLTFRLHFGNSINAAINNLQWGDYNETKVAMIITCQNVDFTNEQFNSIRRLKDIINKQDKFIQMTDVQEGCVFVSMTVHPFALQSNEVLSTEVMQVLKKIVEQINDGRVIIIDAVLFVTNDDFGESSILPFFANDAEEEKPCDNDDLVLTAKQNGSHQETESHLYQVFIDVVKDIVNSSDMSMSTVHVTVSESLIEQQVQAQYPLTPQMLYKANFKQKYELRMPIHGCAMVGTTIALASNAEAKLLLIDTVNGSERDIPLSGKGYFVSAINDTTVVVYLANDHIIEIIDLEAVDVKKELKINEKSYCLCYYNGQFFVSLGKEIEVMDLEGQVLHKLPVPCFIWSITADRDRIYYPHGDTLYCCDIYGKMIWKFTDDIIQGMKRQTTDSNGNVYMSGTSKCNLAIVTSDGKYQKELISESDPIEINSPIALCCDKKCDVFVIVDQSGSVFLFDVLKEV